MIFSVMKDHVFMGEINVEDTFYSRYLNINYI
jgi:hypothetical protein